MADASTPQDKLIQSGLALSSELSLPAVLKRIVDVALEVTDARYGALGVLGGDGQISEFITGGLSEAEERAIGSHPSGKGVLGALMQEEVPLRLNEIGDDPRSVGFPPHHPEMHSFLGAPVRSRGLVFGNLYLADKGGAEGFTEEDESSVVVLAAQAGIAIENARLYEETLQRERSLDSIREVTESILRGVGAEEALELVAERARELVGAELASIALPTGDGASLTLRAVSGAHAYLLRGQSFPYEGSVSGDVVATGQPAMIGDLTADERAYQPVVRIGEMGPAVFVPLSIGGTAFGTLGVANLHKGKPFSERDLKLLETFAAQASVAVEYARAHGELQRMAVMEDRERIAKELHDGVIQSLFAVGMGLEATGSLCQEEEVGGGIEQASNEIDRVIRDLRNYIFGLRPGILADRQLDQALRDLAQDFAAKTGIVVAVEIEPSAAAELSSRAGDLVQLTREALSNIGRHSQAETCSLRLHHTDEGAVLEVDDDGCGFDVGSAEGNGLRNIRERAKSLGGTADITSTDGEGTTIKVALPID